MAEAVVFLEAAGVDTRAAVEVLAGSAVRTARPRLCTAATSPRVPGRAPHKDMGIVTAAAREAGVIIPLGALVAQLLASLSAQGDGGLDHSALLKLIERLSGR